MQLGQVAEALRHRAAPERHVDGDLAVGRRSLDLQGGDAGGRRDGVQRHVDDRRHAAGCRGPGGGGEALPLGAARLVDVHVGVDQPGQQHLVVGELDRSRRPPGRPASSGSTATIRPSVTATGRWRDPVARSATWPWTAQLERAHRQPFVRDPAARPWPAGVRRWRCFGPGPAPGRDAGTRRRSRPGAGRSAVRALRPATATTGTPARPAAWATPIGALPPGTARRASPRR